MSLFRKIWACSLTLALLLAAAPAAAQTLALEGSYAVSQPRPGAAAAVLIEAQSGQVLFSVNGNTPLPPASTTKILTALLALDLSDELGKSYTVSEEAAAVPEASAGLRAGQSLTLAELLQGALIHSGNDACHAIAEALAGGEELFVHWMNMKAATLGAYSVDFSNVSGLPDQQHLVSAHDLALLAAYALENDFFAATVRSKYGGGWRNTNKLLWQDEHVIGVKTGTTDAAGPCLVAAYQKGAARYISVVLHSPDRYGESYALLRYGEQQYIRVQVAEMGQTLAWANGRLLCAAETLSVFLPREQLPGLRLRWEIESNAPAGTLALYDQEGELLGETQLIVAR